MAGDAPNFAEVSTEVAPVASFQWEFDKDAVSTAYIYSPSIEVGGMPWSVAVCTRDTNDVNHLSVYLCQLEGDYTVHRVDAEFLFKIINHEDDAKTIKSEYYEMPFDKTIRYWNHPDLIKWETAIDENKGFMKDNKLTVEVEFKLLSTEGLRMPPPINYADPDDPCHDMALVIEGEKVFVNKGHLSFHSPVFKSMFYGEFAEKNQQEVELKDIVHKEFLDVLDTLHSRYKKITDTNFEYLLKLGDRFEIDLVVSRVEQFLIDSSELTLAAKLLLAGRYHLFDLQDDCIERLKTIKDIAVVKKTKESKNFSHAIDRALLDKMVKLAD